MYRIIEAPAIPGTKLLKMLKECGSFETIEMQLKRWKKNTVNEDKLGGWVTKHWLITQKSYTKHPDAC